MKKIVIAVTLMLVMLTGCNTKPSEESFQKDSNRLYTQIFKDGEQSDKVNDMYTEYMSEYKTYDNEKLYKELDNLYQSLNKDDGKSSRYLASVMRILNN